MVLMTGSIVTYRGFGDCASACLAGRLAPIAGAPDPGLTSVGFGNVGFGLSAFSF